MNWDAIGAVGEILGATGVIITLVYLASQIRSQTQEARLLATRDLSRDYRDIMKEVAVDKELYAIYLSSLKSYDDLPDDDRMRIHLFFYSRIFGVHEQQHLHLKEGTIDPVFLQSIRNRLTEAARGPGTHQWWARNSHLYNEEFRIYIDDVLTRALQLAEIQSPANANGPVG
jgi:hypothetical protein